MEFLEVFGALVGVCSLAFLAVAVFCAWGLKYDDEEYCD